VTPVSASDAGAAGSGGRRVGPYVVRRVDRAKFMTVARRFFDHFLKRPVRLSGRRSGVAGASLALPYGMSRGPIVRTIEIDAAPRAVWGALTDADSMKRWMAHPDVGMDIITDWVVGAPIVVHGFHIVRFENRGTVLAFDPPRLLRYSHLSSLSRLPDSIESHAVFEFRLDPSDSRTALTVTVSNFPTEAIFKHLDFYWRGALGAVKQFVERTS